MRSPTGLRGSPFNDPPQRLMDGPRSHGNTDASSVEHLRRRLTLRSRALIKSTGASLEKQ